MAALGDGVATPVPATEVPRITDCCASPSAVSMRTARRRPPVRATQGAQATNADLASALTNRPRVVNVHENPLLTDPPPLPRGVNLGEVTQG